MDDIKHILTRSEVLGDLPEENLENLISFTDEWQTLPGEILAAAGNAAWYSFVLKEGSLLLVLEKERACVLSTPGDFIGLELMASEGVCSATLQVLEKGSVLVLPEQEIQKMVREDASTAEVFAPAWEAYLKKTAPFGVKN